NRGCSSEAEGIMRRFSGKSVLWERGGRSNGEASPSGQRPCSSGLELESVAKAVQVFAGFAHQQDPFVFAVGERFNVDRRGIAVAQVDPLADFRRNSAGERDLHAR